MATLQECIEAYEASWAHRDPSRPVRVIRVALLRTRDWRADDRMFAGKGGALRGGQKAVVDTLAATGEHLELDRVGLVISEDRHG